MENLERFKFRVFNGVNESVKRERERAASLKKDEEKMEGHKGN